MAAKHKVSKSQVPGVSDVARPFDGTTAQDFQSGHRDRLRERFVNGGANALPDYELLELVLFAAIPRRDVKPLAKALLARFGSFADVIAAPRERLLEIDGIGENAVTQLKIVEAAALRLSQTKLIGKPALSSWQALLDYCKAAMARTAREEFRVLFLDRKNILIADEVQSAGTVDHTPVYPREIVKRALEHSASALILVHNHPSGDPTPSRADIEMTREIAAASKPLGIAIHDHLVIGRNGHASFKSMGLL
ncbi:MAG TPA: DNA repair protein RadC [Rhizomicrobium sp.]|jgi:DNA repair protein RadC|nr:DNA repair protein RadC [Rhizomicrobium sp.]